jgi:hypothetical protein
MVINAGVGLGERWSGGFWIGQRIFRKMLGRTV